MKKGIFILAASAFLVSCDPPHFITLKNTTSSNAKVKIVLREDVMERAYEKFRAGDSVILNLKGKESAMLQFGIGTWSDSEVSKVANTMKSLEIYNGASSIIYNTPETIEAFLKDNREGFLKGWQTEIEIAVE